MATLPQLRHWVAVPLMAAVLIVAAGLALRFIPALTSADMPVDAELSHDHTAPLTGVAMFISGLVLLASAPRDDAPQHARLLVTPTLAIAQNATLVGAVGKF